MKIGVPKEIKTNENRVALVPAGAEALVAAGHSVHVETGAGLGAKHGDARNFELGVVTEDFDTIVSRALAEAHGTYAVPRYMTREDAFALLDQLLAD